MTTKQLRSELQDRFPVGKIALKGSFQSLVTSNHRLNSVPQTPHIFFGACLNPPLQRIVLNYEHRGK
jgi:hypothetical protein